MTRGHDAQGQVTFENLVPGRYSISAEFPGFRRASLPDVRVRAGENRQVLVLPLDRAPVRRHRRRATGSRRPSDRDVTFGTVMTREQIEALSDDPDELRRQLMDIGGPGREDPRRQLRGTRAAAQGA